MWKILLISSLATSCMVGDPPLEPDEAELDLRAAAAPVLTWPVVRLGDSNRTVVTAQYLLRDAGLPVSVDGAFRTDTVASARSFQSMHDLPVDGVIGATSWARLVVQVSSGSSRAAVSAVQDLLKNRYDKSLDVSGVFGATTVRLVSEFQTERCLAATGVVGLYTWNALIVDRTYCSGGGGGSAAQRILAAHNAGSITLWDQTFGRFYGADPLTNLRDAAAGRAAKTSCYGNAPCTTVTLSSRLLDNVDRLRTQYGFRFFVTAVAGATHAAGSYHYAGRAIDVDEVNGVRISGDSATARQWMAACAALGAVEVFGPNNDAAHQDHLHCAW
ncbi:MAG: peptidoglycan-binding protein [Proteobacteria bacterium]|nr:peptidoglycan-binding protein [Pseudomonadota bacterium]